MNDAERDAKLARLEAQVESLDKSVEEIKTEQIAARERMQSIQLEAATMSGEAGKLIAALNTHLGWHQSHDERKFKVTDIVLALGMMAIAVLELVRG